MNPPHERCATQLDGGRQQCVERQEDGECQQDRNAPAGRIDAVLAIQRHQLGVHLLLGRVGALELGVALLDRFGLGLNLLHLAHRDDALVVEREQRQVDEDREDEDRPAVVTDVPVDPVQGTEQRDDDDGEHAEVDGLRDVPVDRGKRVELLGTGEEGELLIRG